jgi:hypothetical protein
VRRAVPANLRDVRLTVKHAPAPASSRRDRRTARRN